MVEMGRVRRLKRKKERKKERVGEKKSWRGRG
jgi:hypothetical protein